jgi:hypothetical protein
MADTCPCTAPYDQCLGSYDELVPMSAVRRAHRERRPQAVRAALTKHTEACSGSDDVEVLALREAATAADTGKKREWAKQRLAYLTELGPLDRQLVSDAYQHEPTGDYYHLNGKAIHEVAKRHSIHPTEVLQDEAEYNSERMSEQNRMRRELASHHRQLANVILSTGHKRLFGSGNGEMTLLLKAAEPSPPHFIPAQEEVMADAAGTRLPVLAQAQPTCGGSWRDKGKWPGWHIRAYGTAASHIFGRLLQRPGAILTPVSSSAPGGGEGCSESSAKRPRPEVAKCRYAIFSLWERMVPEEVSNDIFMGGKSDWCAAEEAMDHLREYKRNDSANIYPHPSQGQESDKVLKQMGHDRVWAKATCHVPILVLKCYVAYTANVSKSQVKRHLYDHGLWDLSRGLPGGPMRLRHCLTQARYVRMSHLWQCHQASLQCMGRSSAWRTSKDEERLVQGPFELGKEARSKTYKTRGPPVFRLPRQDCLYHVTIVPDNGGDRTEAASRFKKLLVEEARVQVYLALSIGVTLDEIEAGLEVNRLADYQPSPLWLDGLHVAPRARVFTHVIHYSGALGLYEARRLAQRLWSRPISPSGSYIASAKICDQYFCTALDYYRGERVAIIDLCPGYDEVTPREQADPWESDQEEYAGSSDEEEDDEEDSQEDDDYEEEEDSAGPDVQGPSGRPECGQHGCQGALATRAPADTGEPNSGRLGHGDDEADVVPPPWDVERPRADLVGYASWFPSDDLLKLMGPKQRGATPETWLVGYGRRLMRAEVVIILCPTPPEDWYATRALSPVDHSRKRQLKQDEEIAKEIVQRIDYYYELKDRQVVRVCEGYPSN